MQNSELPGCYGVLNDQIRSKFSQKQTDPHGAHFIPCSPISFEQDCCFLQNFLILKGSPRHPYIKLHDTKYEIECEMTLWIRPCLAFKIHDHLKPKSFGGSAPGPHETLKVGPWTPPTCQGNMIDGLSNNCAIMNRHRLENYKWYLIVSSK